MSYGDKVSESDANLTNEAAEALSDQSEVMKLSEEAAKKAEVLGTPLEIYNYLRNNINYEFYYGSRKGASGTFAALAGNDMDQASLMIAMLRYMGYEANYVCGKIELDKEQALALTGASEMHLAAEILATCGTPVTTITVEDEITSIWLEHVWVRANIPYTDYRGAGNAEGEKVWIDLDTGIKKYDKVKNLYDTIDKDKMLEELLTVSANSLTEEAGGVVATWQQQIASEAGNWVNIRSRVIAYNEGSYLPLSLQYRVIEEVETFEHPSQQKSDQVTFYIAGENFGTFSSVEVLGREVLLSYLPQDETEEEIYNSYASIFDIPSYAVKMVPVLTIDGEVRAKGSSAQACRLGEMSNMTMQLRSGNETQTVDNNITCGSMYAITFDAQNITAAELENAYDALVEAADSADIKNVYSTAYLGKLLAVAGKQYFAQIDIANIIAMEMYKVQASRILGAGMTGYEVRTTYRYGQLIGISEGSLYIDVDANTMAVTSLEGNVKDEREFMAVTGMMSSLYENVVWEQLTGIESVSTMSLLGRAQAQGTEILVISKENLSSSLKKLSASDSVKEEIRTKVAAGNIVIIPEKELSVNEWNGTGYMIVDPTTGVGSYMINGGVTQGQISGGALTGIVTLETLLGLICSAYVEAALFAGIVATAQALAGATLVAAVGGYVMIAVALVSTLVIFAKTYELYLAYIDYMITGDLDSANDVMRIAFELGTEALITAITMKIEDGFEKSGDSDGNSGGSASEGGSKPHKLFKNQSLLDEHYRKHGQEIADVLGDSNYSIDKYLDDANYIINNGTYTPELNGYVSFMSGKKYGFVGLDRTTGDITTFHIKNISELIKKAPSLGFER